MARVADIDLSHVHTVGSIFTGDADPTPDLDISKGYCLGDEYYNTAAGTVFKCIDSTAGAAQWCAVTLAAPVARQQPEGNGAATGATGAAPTTDATGATGATGSVAGATGTTGATGDTTTTTTNTTTNTTSTSTTEEGTITRPT